MVWRNANDSSYFHKRKKMGFGAGLTCQRLSVWYPRQAETLASRISSIVHSLHPALPLALNDLTNSPLSPQWLWIQVDGL